MNKKIMLTNLAAILATNVAIASEIKQISLPKAQPNPASKAKLAYGCIGSGDGQFQGKVSCEGKVVGGCVASPVAPSPGTKDDPTSQDQDQTQGATPSPDSAPNGDEDSNMQSDEHELTTPAPDEEMNQDNSNTDNEQQELDQEDQNGTSGM